MVWDFYSFTLLPFMNIFGMSSSLVFEHHERLLSQTHWKSERRSVPIVPFDGLALLDTVYPKKYAHGFVVLCFVVVMQSFIMNSHEVFIHIHQGYFAGTGAIVRLPQCQWSKPDGYGKISQCITTTMHSKAVTVCIFLGIYCTTAFAGLLMMKSLSLCCIVLCCIVLCCVV